MYYNLPTAVRSCDDVTVPERLLIIGGTDVLMQGDRFDRDDVIRAMQWSDIHVKAPQGVWPRVVIVDPDMSATDMIAPSTYFVGAWLECMFGQDRRDFQLTLKFPRTTGVDGGPIKVGPLGNPGARHKGVIYVYGAEFFASSPWPGFCHWRNILATNIGPIEYLGNPMQPGANQAILNETLLYGRIARTSDDGVQEVYYLSSSEGQSFVHPYRLRRTYSRSGQEADHR